MEFKMLEMVSSNYQNKVDLVADGLKILPLAVKFLLLG